MKPDHEIDWTAAGKLAENWARLCYPETPEGNLARAYLDAMAQLDKAEKMRDVAYGLLDECKARLDKATELLRAALGRSECYDEDHECGETDTTRAIRAFLDERK